MLRIAICDDGTACRPIQPEHRGGLPEAMRKRRRNRRLHHSTNLLYDITRMDFFDLILLNIEMAGSTGWSCRGNQAFFCPCEDHLLTSM